MEHTIFNPPSFEPIHINTFPTRTKVHIVVLTASRTIRFARIKDTLEHGDFGGTQITDTTGAVELEVRGDMWMHGISSNAGTTKVDVEF